MSNFIALSVEYLTNMPAFDPRPEYDIIQQTYSIAEFSDYQEEFVERPPYQRKNVWSKQKKYDLLDSLFRQYYVPRIVLREVRIDKDNKLYEVIDGQQRINTAVLFIQNKIKLPETLGDLHKDLPGAYFDELSSEIRRFVDREITYTADIVKGLENPTDADHLEIATEIFWRLQQGESLNYMEIAHSRLNSKARNFVVKFADDQEFDYQAYSPVDGNPNKHDFFSVVGTDNKRMKHLSLMIRFCMIEEADGPTDIKHTDVNNYIDKYRVPNGIDNNDFEKSRVGKSVLSIMDFIHDVFADDPSVKSGDGMKELTTEYFIISFYTLVRHLKNQYIIDESLINSIREFLPYMHERWKLRENSDTIILEFSDKRQQSSTDLSIRDNIMKQLYFQFAADSEFEIKSKDSQRVFNPIQRIMIYRRDNGLCQMCLEDGLPEEEAKIAWSDYEADHIVPHAKGGQTNLDNAQLLCSTHNKQKGANMR